MKIYYGKIENEVEKPTNAQCFLGAWYHKVFSSKDKWLGIEGIITLPEVKINRKDINGKSLDNPSIYMGGLSKYESDVGLSYSKVILKDGNISKNSEVFRPFWRYITDLDTDEGSYDFENGRFYNVSNLTPNSKTSNCYAHYSPKFSEYYYLPGDKIKLVVTYPKKNHMQLVIEVIEISKNKNSIKKRRDNNWKDPETFKSPLFTSPENIDSIKEFKRVNAIDQVSNEGKPTINTKTVIKNAIWESVYLYRKTDGEVFKVPLVESRAQVMNCPTIDGFELSKINEDGGSTITINPGKLI